MTYSSGGANKNFTVVNDEWNFLVDKHDALEPKLMLFQRKLDFSVKSKLKTPVPLKLLFLC